jgi:uncharacterized SAM-binding protein YcdF (DUF218 family)
MSTWSRRRSLILLSTAVLLMTIVYLTREPILLRLGSFLIVHDNLHPADLIHPLGGGYDRLDYAVKLYKKGYAHRIFVTGDDDAIIYRKYVIAKGTPAENVFPDKSWSTTTYEEALELKKFFEHQSSIKSVIVVSNPYQMRRARWTFQKVLGDQVDLQFAPVPFETARYKKRWWMDPKSRTSVISEYFKLPYYYLRYGFM